MKRTSYPVKDIEVMERPDLVWIYDPQTGRGPLHITDKSCVHGPRGYHKSLARCGRVIDPDHHAWNLGSDGLAPFRLCQRCGTADGFAQALAEYTAWEIERIASDKTRREREQAEREAVWADKTHRVKDLAAFLVEAGLRVGVTDGTAMVERDGYEFELKCKGRVGTTTP